MLALYAADLHLTDSHYDEYRWEIFPWMVKHGKRLGVTQIFILGDLTDQKDNHSSRLVNRVVSELRLLSRVAPVHVLKGNHDYIEESAPFFRFLSNLKGVRFYNKVSEVEIEGLSFLMLPHSRKLYRKGHQFMVNTKGFDRVLFHFPLSGSEGSNGRPVPGGVDRKIFAKCKLAIGGDIHVPQRIGSAIYVGAPYPVHMGDCYRPRVLVDDGKVLKSLYRSTLKKVMVCIRSVDELQSLDLSSGDQIKVTYELPRTEFHEWPAVRTAIQRWCEEEQVILRGLSARKLDPKVVQVGESGAVGLVRSPLELFNSYCTSRSIEPRLRRVGAKFIPNR